MSGTGVGIGQRPENTRQRLVKLLWTGIWLVYLSAPASDLLHGGHSTGVRILGWIGLGAFVTWYMLLLFRTGRGERNSVVLASLLRARDRDQIKAPSASLGPSNLSSP